jgi:hypothetical protein
VQDFSLKQSSLASPSRPVRVDRELAVGGKTSALGFVKSVADVNDVFRPLRVRETASFIRRDGVISQERVVVIRRRVQVA